SPTSVHTCQLLSSFSFTDPAPPAPSTLSLHDALPISPRPAATLILLRPGGDGVEVLMIQRAKSAAFLGGAYVFPGGALDAADSRSEEHTSELQSLRHLVCRLLLEKKKKEPPHQKHFTH